MSLLSRLVSSTTPSLSVGAGRALSLTSDFLHILSGWLSVAHIEDDI